MKKNIFILAMILASCSAQIEKVTDDILEGEVQVVEKAIHDTLPPERPSVMIPIRKF
jgi:hypothetical protein